MDWDKAEREFDADDPRQDYEQGGDDGDQDREREFLRPRDCPQGFHADDALFFRGQSPHDRRLD